MTAAEMFCERVLDGITNWDKPKTKQDEENVAKDELYEALVEDADTLPQGETLEEHDRKKHKGHFDPSTQTCKFRDEMKKETDADRADEIRPESAPTAEGGEEGGQNKPLVSPEEDKAYMEAVERGDMETAEKMVREVAGRAFPNTKVIDKDGLPKVVYHGGNFRKYYTIPDLKPGEMHFGTLEAAKERVKYKYQGMEDSVSIDGYFLNLENPKRTEDLWGHSLWLDWSDEEDRKHDGVVYKNESEDEGNDSYGVSWAPSRIKSADPVTYDNDGNIIPLSRRFDSGNDIRGDVKGGSDGDTPSSVEQEESEDLESYDKNFTEDGEWKSPWNNGGPTFDTRKSVGVARNPWTKASRAEAEMAAQMLKRVLGGVTVGFSDKPYEGEGDTRKSIGGIFTGSAADYDKPSLLKVGTGEGSQVYGCGLYGSTVRGVAEGYAGSQEQGEFAYKGRTLSYYDSHPEEEYPYALEVLSFYGGKTIKESINMMKENYNKTKNESLLEAISQLESEPESYSVPQTNDYIYEQTFFTDREPGDESHLLKWYEPVTSEQMDWIESRLKAEGIGNVNIPFLKGELPNPDNPSGGPANAKIKNGRTVYDHLANKLGSPKAASELLARAGIDGVKYPVDSYGGKSMKDGDEAGWNYVSFRDDNIRVDHKWVDGELRYFRNSAGKVVGEYDRNTNKITLYPGATVRDVVHEYSHGLWQFAEQEAEEGRGDLLDKMKSIADTAPEEVKRAVAANYEEVTPDVYLEECFTHEMARRSDTAFAKAIGSKEGKPWYKRVWGAIKDAWKGLATKMGLNKADISKIGKMSDGEAAEHILSQMMEGKRFGEVKKGQGDTRNSKSAGDTFELPNGTKVPANLAYLYKGMDGTPHNEKWSPFLEKTTGNGAISKDFSDVLDKLFSGKLVDADTIKSIPEWKDAMLREKRIQDDLEKKHGVRTTAEINDSTREKLRSSLIRAAMTDHITRTVPLEGFEGMEFETNEGLKDGESYDVEKGRVMTVVIGLPAAGKSTTFANPLAKKFKARLCDSDTVKKTLPEFSNGYGGNVVHEESTKINEEILKRSIEQGDNIVYPILGYKPDKLKKLFGQLREKGYKINLCLKDMPANIALGRLLGRFMGKGRYLPIECITKAMGKFGDCFEQVKDLVDAYVRATSDPDGTNERIIESKGDLI